MKRLIILKAILLMAVFGYAQTEYPVSYTFPDTVESHPDSVFSVRVLFSAGDSWYIYAPTGNNAAQGMIETNMIFNLPKGIARKGKMQLPESKFKGGFEVYDGKNINFTQLFTVSREVAPGIYIIKGKVTYQTCNEKICLPPKTDEVEIKVVVKQALKTAGQGEAASQQKSGTTARGIQFEKDNFSSVLNKARAENKLVFIDAFTTWCGPCKWMEQHAFPNEQIGEFFNANFVNTKIDMEKGEGIGLRTRYGVHAFPTYLFVNGEGELVHRFVGSMGLDDFVKGAEKALDPDQQYYTLAKRYQSGERDPDFLYQLAYSGRSAGEDSASYVYADSYLKTQTDWLKDANLKLISSFTNSPQQKYYTFMKDHPTEFKKLLGSEVYEQKLYDVAYRAADAAIGLKSGLKMGGEQEYLKKAKQYFHEVLAEQEAKLSGRYAIKLYAMTRNLDAYAHSMVAYYEQFPPGSADELNQIAWNFYENIENPAYLKAALNWALESVDLKKGYGNLDTVASLYAKLGAKEKAKVYAKQAIALGKAMGADVGTTEKLLKTLQ